MTGRQSTAVILLAGGTGSRMQSEIPKQFLLLKDKPIVSYSFDVFTSMLQIAEIVVVCAAEYRHLFTLPARSSIVLTFALPGVRRQDSVYSGLCALKTHPSIVCVHDGARPFITVPIVENVLAVAQEHGAATVGMPVKFTVKECDAHNIVTRTPNRSHLWEIQTPQAIRIDWLKRGFEKALAQNITVTDDVSLVELIGLPVHVVEASYRNLKITTPEDLLLADLQTQYLNKT